MAGTITSGWTNSFKVELAKAIHNFTASTGHTFKIMLLKAESALAANYGPGTTTCTVGMADELAGSGGYTQGGISLTNITPTTAGGTSSVPSYWSWSNNPQWTAATFDTQGALIYNFSAGTPYPVVAVIRWGAAPMSLVNGTGTVTWPTNDATTAPMRIL